MERLKRWFYSVKTKLSVKFNRKQHSPIVFLNSPITRENQDVIGIKSAADAIIAAVKQSAQMIGLIADYGAGKSSLTEMLATYKWHFKKVIHINMWDAISRAKSKGNEKENVSGTIDSLTKSFIFQLATGISANTARYINRRLSKNFGIISFSLSSWSFWAWFTGSVVLCVLYAILTNVDATILAGAVQLFSTKLPIEDIVKYSELAKSGAYIFLAVGILFLLIGMRNTNVAYSYWKSKNIEPELNDIFEAYFHVYKKLQGKWRRNLIVIEDLDRISDRELVVGFLREIYRFGSLMPKGNKKAPVFLIAVMPEVNLADNINKQQGNDAELLHGEGNENKREEKKQQESIYEKIFDYTINLRPIHYEDYAEILLSIIGNESSINRRAINSLLEGKKIGDKLPPSFNWLIKGHNLTIRQLKERLNSAVSLLVTLKNKGYENQSYINFSSCAAVTYLEHQYPHIFYAFVSRENELSKLVQDVLEAKNGSNEDIDKLLNTFFSDEAFRQHSDIQEMQEDVKEMLVSGDISDDFRMYFYSFPKNSYIKNSDERDIYNLLVWPKEHAEDDNLDNKIDRLIASKKTSVVDSTLKNLIESDVGLPQIVLKNKYLFKTAFSESPAAVLRCVKRFISWKTNKLQDSQAQIEYIYSYGLNDYRGLWNGYAYWLANAFSDIDDKDKVDIRYRLICVLSDDITVFRGLYEKIDEKPVLHINPDNTCSEFVLISEKELERIPTRDVAISLINIELIKAEDVGYISDYINAEGVSSQSVEKAISVYEHILDLFPSAELWKKTLAFLRLNKIVNDELFAYVLSGIDKESEEDRSEVGEYLGEVPSELISDRYYTLIDEYRIDRLLPDNVTNELYERQLLTALISFCAYADQLSDFDFTPGSYRSAIQTACANLKGSSPNVIPKFRKELLLQLKEKSLLDSVSDNFESIFYGDNPLITQQEMDIIPDTITILKLLNRTQIQADDCAEIIAQLNEKIGLSNAVTFFRLLLSTEYSDAYSDSVIANRLIDSIDYQAMSFSELTQDDIAQIIGYIGQYRDFNNFEVANRFMHIVNCMIPQLERVVAAKSIPLYTETLLMVGNPSDFSLQWIDDNEVAFALPEKILDYLLNTEKYQKYLVGKVLLQNMFSFPFADVPDIVVVNEYRPASPIWKFLKDDSNLIKYILENGHFKEFNSNDCPEIIKPLYNGKQTVEFASFVLENTTTNDRIVYLLEMGEIANEDNSAAISKLLVEDKYISLLQDEAVFGKVYERLWENAPKHSGHKSYFSKKRNEWMKNH